MRLVVVLFIAALLTAVGCGGPEADQPAELTPELEQEIIEEVEQALQEERKRATPNSSSSKN